MITEKYTRPQIVRMIERQGLRLFPNFEKNINELSRDPIFNTYEYGDLVLVAGIMYAMLKNRGIDD